MSQVICISEDILGGVPVFKGTRVPIAALFDYLEDGDSIDEFLLDFRSVSRNQVIFERVQFCTLHFEQVV